MIRLSVYAQKKITKIAESNRLVALGGKNFQIISIAQPQLVVSKCALAGTPKPPLCKGRWLAKQDGGIVKN